MRLLQTMDRTAGQHTYPATTAQIIEEYGDLELELADGTERLGTVLGRLDPETYQGYDDLRLTTLSALGAGAIGRKGYSDRDPTCMGEDGHTQISF